MVNKTLTEICCEYRENIAKADPTATFPNVNTSKRRKKNNENIADKENLASSQHASFQNTVNRQSIVNPEIFTENDQNLSFDFNFVTQSYNLLHKDVDDTTNDYFN